MPNANLAFGYSGLKRLKPHALIQCKEGEVALSQSGRTAQQVVETVRLTAVPGWPFVTRMDRSYW